MQWQRHVREAAGGPDARCDPFHPEALLRAVTQNAAAVTDECGEVPWNTDSDTTRGGADHIMPENAHSTRTPG